MTDRSATQPERDPASDRPGSRDRESATKDPSGGWMTHPSPETTAEVPPQGMIPARARRRTQLERGSMRVLATGGIIGIATVLGAVLVGQDVAGWIVGLAVGLTSVVLAALLWSSRQL
jgi:hypothetical protein